MPDRNWLEIKQKLSNPPGLNFRHLKFIRFVHPHYSNIIWRYSKKCEEKSVSVLMGLYNENEVGNGK